MHAYILAMPAPLDASTLLARCVGLCTPPSVIRRRSTCTLGTSASACACRSSSGASRPSASTGRASRRRPLEEPRLREPHQRVPLLSGPPSAVCVWADAHILFTPRRARCYSCTWAPSASLAPRAMCCPTDSATTSPTATGRAAGAGRMHESRTHGDESGAGPAGGQLVHDALLHPRHGRCPSQARRRQGL